MQHQLDLYLKGRVEEFDSGSYAITVAIGGFAVPEAEQPVWTGSWSSQRPADEQVQAAVGNVLKTLACLIRERMEQD